MLKVKNEWREDRDDRAGQTAESHHELLEAGMRAIVRSAGNPICSYPNASKRRLRAITPAKAPWILLLDGIEERVIDLFGLACKLDLEGIVAK